MSDLYTVEPDGTVIATMQNGRIVECLPVGDLLMRVGSRIEQPEEPEPPTYQMDGVGGSSETRPHDAESIADPKTSDEERAAWEIYSARLVGYELRAAEVEEQIKQMRGTFILLEGMKVRDLPDDLETWAKQRSERYGLEIDSDTPEDLLMSYVGHHITRTEKDVARIASGIFRATGLDQEALEQVERSFLDSLEGRSGRGDDSGDQDVSS